MNTLKHLILSLVLAAIVSTVNAQDYNNIEFIENKGQWDSRVKFKGDVDAGSIFIRSTGFTILQYNKQDYAGVRSYLHKENSGTALKNSAGDMVIRSHAYDVDFVGASPAIQVIPDKAIPTYNNYFIGDDPSKWGSNCRIYQAVTLKDVYPNVDVRYYTDNGTLKYDIIARPGADISKIALKYNGVDKLEIKNKELVAVTSVGNLRESLPSTYQVRSNGRSEISNRYVVKDNIVRFDIKNYDRSSTLVIDPSPIFCSFSGSTATNWGFTATYGPDGSFYGGGIIFGSSSFPSPGAYQTNYQGGEFDIGIIKLSANGANRIYATYIGGSGDDQPHSLVVTPQGELILAGRTNSPLPGASNGTPYPVIGAIAGSGGGYDIVVTKLNAAGNALIGSKRIGGPGDDGVNISESRSGTNSLQRNYGDDGRSEVIIDGGGNVYVASCTQSQGTTANPSFPVTAGAFQPNTGGGTQDGVVLKLTSNLSTVSFASYLGGSGNDAAYVLTLGPTGDIYVAGGTEQGSSATDFSGNHAGTVGPSSNGSIDGFVARISNNGSSIIRSTYIGTSGVDQVYGIQFDRKGFLYVMGTTTGQWFITPGTKTFGSGGVNGKQFITKLQPDLSAYIYSTVFGTPSAAPNISPTAFLVDRCENVYVSGWGGLNDQSRAYETSGTSGLPVTADADQATTDGHDFYFFVLEKNATSQLYGSFFGQNGGRYGDHVDGGTSRFDPNGVIYQAVCANCGGGATFPTTIGAWSRVNRALPDGCNLGMVKIAFNLAGVGANVQSAIGGVPNDTAGCLPLEVVFTDQVRNATSYIWNFGDGSPEVGPLPAATGYTQPHTFNNVGTYRVMLIAINPSSCNERDTSYINIKVGDLKANLVMDIDKLDPCEAFNYQFNNLSTTNPSRPFTDTSFIWDFGDRTPRVRAGLIAVTHSYLAPGTYFVRLILNDTAYCNNPDSIEIELRVAANVVASFETPAVGCAPYTAVFKNTSVGGATFDWNFGDPTSADNTSTLINPTHFYSNPGTYKITLVATDPNTCNKTDDTTFTINVYDKPTASFSYTPVVPIVNTPNIFTNQSSPDAVKFKWLFGDGDSLITTSRADVEHQYIATGSYTACLIAYNAIGCSDDTCQLVSVIIDPAVDVPNAFTPNSGSINSVVKVRGFGISKMRFIIWNRWGQKVFESNSINQGWDGKVGGVVQPMDVYAYTLSVEFFDGVKATKKGDITLIR